MPTYQVTYRLNGDTASSVTAVTAVTPAAARRAVRRMFLLRRVTILTVT
jgi:hypothetical protein